jgi:hypothetical protein
MVIMVIARTGCAALTRGSKIKTGKDKNGSAIREK